MRERVLFPDDLRGGHFLHQAGCAVNDVGKVELELAVGSLKVAVDKVIQLLRVLIELVSGLLPVFVIGEAEVIPAPQVSLNAVPAGPLLEYVFIGDIFASVRGEVLDAGIERGVEVARLLDTEGLRSGLDALIIRAGEREQLLGLLGIPAGVGLGKRLRPGEQLPDLVLHIRGVVRDRPVLSLFFVVSECDFFALGDREILEPDKIANHVRLARRVVRPLLQRGRQVCCGSGANVFLL